MTSIKQQIQNQTGEILTDAIRSKSTARHPLSIILILNGKEQFVRFPFEPKAKLAFYYPVDAYDLHDNKSGRIV
jgi:hypothetical protein